MRRTSGNSLARRLGLALDDPEQPATAAPARAGTAMAARRAANARAMALQRIASAGGEIVVVVDDDDDDDDDDVANEALALVLGQDTVQVASLTGPGGEGGEQGAAGWCKAAAKMKAVTRVDNAAGIKWGDSTEAIKVRLRIPTSVTDQIFESPTV